MLDRLKQYFNRDRKARDCARRPVVSFVMVVYDMPVQAQNTVTSLLCDYQVGASPRDYEVIIVENESKNPMSQDFVQALPDNFHYYLRQEDRPTPIYAVEFGASKAQGENICLMIDGARLLTPGVVKNIVLGHSVDDSAVVTVPGYHIGSELQQEAVDRGYSIEKEREMMRAIAWPEEGYRLFDIACFSGSCARGIFMRNSESNCISIPRELWTQLGGCDRRFDLRGGGLVNLDLYKRACETPGVTHIVLHGEGTFHQFHGGVTTGGEAREVRDRFIQASKDQYREIRGHDYASPRTDPIYLGALAQPVQKFIHFSSEKKLENSGCPPVVRGAVNQ
jgi:hypothetical protein